MKRHWTDESAKDFMFAVAMDFVSELTRIMDEHSLTRKDLAQRLGIRRCFVDIN